MNQHVDISGMDAVQPGSESGRSKAIKAQLNYLKDRRAEVAALFE